MSRCTLVLRRNQEQRGTSVENSVPKTLTTHHVETLAKPWAHSVVQRCRAPRAEGNTIEVRKDLHERQRGWFIRLNRLKLKSNRTS